MSKMIKCLLIKHHYPPKEAANPLEAVIGVKNVLGQIKEKNRDS